MLQCIADPYPDTDPVTALPRLRVVDLFSGAGGMSLGLEWAGMKVIKALDSSRSAVDAYRGNVGPHAEIADLSDISSYGPMIKRLAPDVIVGGPPCQDFSSSGERVERSNAHRARDFAMLICSVRPQWFVMENVTGALRSQAWAEARKMLADAGYGLTEMVLDASYYGVPQKRRRLFIVGRLGEADCFLESALRKAASDRPMTIRDVFGDSLGDTIYMHPRAADRRAIFSTYEPAPTVRSTRRPRPASYNPHRNDADQPSSRFFYARSPHVGHDVAAPARKTTSLTQAHTSAFQGFPSDWDWSAAGCPGDIDRLIANAVPPSVAEAVGRAILEREAGRSIPCLSDGFGQWLRSKGYKRQGLANIKTRVNRARRLLRGRWYADPAVEMGALEAAPDFRTLSVKTRSDVRRALRLYQTWTAPSSSPRRVAGAEEAPAYLGSDKRQQDHLRSGWDYGDHCTVRRMPAAGPKPLHVGHHLLPERHHRRASFERALGLPRMKIASGKADGERPPARPREAGRQ